MVVAQEATVVLDVLEVPVGTTDEAAQAAAVDEAVAQEIAVEVVVLAIPYGTADTAVQAAAVVAAVAQEIAAEVFVPAIPYGTADTVVQAMVVVVVVAVDAVVLIPSANSLSDIQSPAPLEQIDEIDASKAADFVEDNFVLIQLAIIYAVVPVNALSVPAPHVHPLVHCSEMD